MMRVVVHDVPFLDGSTRDVVSAPVTMEEAEAIVRYYRDTGWVVTLRGPRRSPR